MTPKWAGREIRSREITKMIGNPMLPCGQGWVRQELTGERLGDVVKNSLWRAVQQVAQHCPTIHVRRIATCEKIISHASYIVGNRTITAEKFGLHWPHDPGIVTEKKGEIIRWRLSRCRLTGRVFIGAVLNIIRLVSREVPTDVGLKKLRNSAFFRIGLRNINVNEDFRDEGITSTP